MHSLNELEEENKILLQNLNSIEDPNIRAYVQEEQTSILSKNMNQQLPYSSTSFGNFLMILVNLEMIYQNIKL